VNVRELQESRARIVTAQESMRREIAAHLHGSVQAKLLVLKGCLQQLQEKTNHPPETVQLLGEVIDAMQSSLSIDLSAFPQELVACLRQLVPGNDGVVVGNNILYEPSITARRYVSLRR